MNSEVVVGPKSFHELLGQNHLNLTRGPLEILQINVGKLCNQSCRHCHVEAGPSRTEIMERKTIERLMELLDRSSGIHTVDITGGAPELDPHFRYLVSQCRKREKAVIDRCNLTVLLEKGQEDLPLFLRDEQVHIVASLPCYLKENVEKQRGRGVFDKSIRALTILNDLGFGKEGTGLMLDLVYNPVGAYLPLLQPELEANYKKELKGKYGIEFNRLYTMTNMPVKRFFNDLKKTGQLEEYMTLLVSHFNARAAENVMCRNLISVDWNGNIYDCDFNQMLEIPAGGKKRTIWDIESFEHFLSENIAFADHCFGCTAGAGSSCGGTLV